ncbi:phosphatase PAP2 family protein [Saccharomonospora sp.]|uniref:phosphatase PAP2 family protein n=1 Tax=Saccharomonospora sp. TaxID=33913 RepID=UPI002621CAF2|nr:phosphatase PAP2 family protein [Saccharomonospora sp.]
MRVEYLLGSLSLTAFVVLGIVVRQDPPAADRALHDAASTWWRDDFDEAAAVISAVLGPPLPILSGLGLIAATVVWRRRSDPRAWVTLRLVVLLGACRLSSVFAKLAFDRERPLKHGDLGYPSGHVASVASTGFVLVVLCLWLAPRSVTTVGVVTVVATVLAGAARVTLQVHWLTDTIGSVLAVVGVGLLVAPALRLLPPRPQGVASSS